MAGAASRVKRRRSGPEICSKSSHTSPSSVVCPKHSGTVNPRPRRSFSYTQTSLLSDFFSTYSPFGEESLYTLYLRL